jgi:GDP-4-dehydro-6-deoxy-D-mannose reductase
VMVTQGIQKPAIHIGNGLIVRDFVDVHDVVEAYYQLLTRGIKGEVYNICSGKGYAIQDIVTLLSEMLNIRVETIQDKSQIRPIDNPRIVGSYQKIQRDIGWKPTISFEQSLLSMYQYWDKRIKDDMKVHPAGTP